MEERDDAWIIVADDIVSCPYCHREQFDREMDAAYLQPKVCEYCGRLFHYAIKTIDLEEDDE